MWGLYLIGLIAYIPATPVQAYLTLTLKRIGFTTFSANMLTAPSAGVQIVTMLALAYSSNHFNERAFHCVFGNLWLIPLFTALLTIPDGGRDWERFSLITLISGYPYFHPVVSSWISENSFDVKKRAITAATYVSWSPSWKLCTLSRLTARLQNVIVQVGSLIGSQIYRKADVPYYKVGNKVCISICALTIVVFVAQRQWLVYLNKTKERAWAALSVEERAAYQADQAAREEDGNKRLDFRFQY